jgi:uncharacterized membrane protein
MREWHIIGIGERRGGHWRIGLLIHEERFESSLHYGHRFGQVKEIDRAWQKSRTKVVWEINMSVIVGVHLYSALGALVLGLLVSFLPKGRFIHRCIGRLWMGLMVIAALSAFGLSSGMIGTYLSPLHGLALFTLFMLWRAYRYARAGRISAHRKTVWGVYWGALVIPGLFAFLLPGRLLNLYLTGWIASF